jgi:serine/threonine protein kinase
VRCVRRADPLGVIFFEMLAGQPPFAGSAHGELIVQHMMHEPPALGPLAEPGAPEALLQLVHRMLAKDKTQRPTMRQAAAELDRLGGHLHSQVSLPGYPAVAAGMSHSVPGLPLATPVPPGIAGPMSIPGLHGGPSYPSAGGMGSAPGVASVGGNPGFGSLSGVASHPGVGSLPGPAPGAPPSTLGLSAGQVPGKPPRRFPISIAIGGVAGALAVAVALFLSIKQPPPHPAPPPPPPPRQVQAPPPEPPKPMVHWAVDSQPTGAMVVRQRDGRALGVTPLSLTIPAASGTEQLRVVLQGYAEAPLSLDLGHDADEKIELRRKSGRDRRRNSDANSKGNNKGYVPGDLTVVD